VSDATNSATSSAPQYRCLISVVIATYNCADSISECLESVVNQDFDSFEVVVADGASNDGTVDVIARFSDRLAWWDSSPDAGIYDAWNKAVTHASGEWLCFLGSDDTLVSPHTLARAAAALQELRGQGKRLAYGTVHMVNARGEVTGAIGAPAGSLVWQFRHGMPKQVSHTGMFHHASLFREHGLFDPQFRIAGDYEFLLRELHRNPGSLCFLPELVTVLKGDGGVSSNPVAILECYRARKRNGMRGLTLFWLLVYLRARFRQILKQRL
jgi:glycosyltransferase involved in cell wall biosynthesis